MGQVSLCDPYVWEDPRYIFRTTWFDSLGRRSTCASELINKIIFVYLIGISLGFLVSTTTTFYTAPMLAVVLSSIILIPTFMNLREVHSFRNEFAESTNTNEGFSEDWTNTNQVGAKPANLPSANAANPFQNVMVDDIKYAPTRQAAPDITNIDKKIELDEYFRVQWYSDPTDVFGKSQSQRQFVTQPSTTVPNDQGSYQDWLYKIPGKTCKEGNPAACYGGTNSGSIPWLN